MRRASPFICLLLLLAPLAALGGEDAPEEEKHAPEEEEHAPHGLDEYTLIAPRNVLVPAVELPVFHLGLVIFNRLVIRDIYTRVSLRSIDENLTGDWVLEAESLWVDYLGHMFHGSLYFNAARSSGLSFWESAAFPIVGGWLWEVAGENKPPSINDLIATGMGGALWGETLHRISQLFLDAPTPPNPLQVVGAFLVDPLGTFNRGVFGERRPRGTLPPLPRTEGYFLLGGSWLGSEAEPEVPTSVRSGIPLQAGVGVELTSSFPSDEKIDHWRPFEYFDLRADFAIPGSPMANAMLRGLLLGHGFGRTGALGGAWGLFGTFDFVSAPAFRLADTGLGLGTAVQLPLWARGRLRTSALLTGLPVGGVGTHEETGEVTNPDGTPLLYFAGSGVAALFDAELAHADVGALRFSARLWSLDTVRDDQRAWDQVTSVMIAARVRLTARHHLGADVTWWHRDAGIQAPLQQDGVVVRLMWVLAFADALPLR